MKSDAEDKELDAHWMRTSGDGDTLDEVTCVMLGSDANGMTKMLGGCDVQNLGKAKADAKAAHRLCVWTCKHQLRVFFHISATKSRRVHQNFFTSHSKPYQKLTFLHVLAMLVQSNSTQFPHYIFQVYITRRSVDKQQI